MMCGMPLFDFRFVDNRFQSKWLPREVPVIPPESAKLEMLSKTILSSTTVRFEFSLDGPAQLNLFFQPYEDVKITKWSFMSEYLEKPQRIHYPIMSV